MFDSQKVWTELKTLIYHNCAHFSNYFLRGDDNNNLVAKKNTITDKSIDLILLLAKCYVHKCKVQNCMPKLTAFYSLLKYI